MTEKPTREQILSEPAGERLDSWVAEFVMGDPRGQVWERAYSTDIAAAWGVVENLTARHHSVAVYWHFSDWRVGTVTGLDSVAVAEIETGPNAYTGPLKRAPSALTAPLAICRAALLAVLDEG